LHALFEEIDGLCKLVIAVPILVIVNDLDELIDFLT